MRKLANFIVDKRTVIMVLVLVLAAFCALLIPKVHVNYDMTKYLPDDSPMRIGTDIMAEQFPNNTVESSIRVMFTDLTSSQITEVYDTLSAIPYVKTVDYEAGSEDYNKGAYTKFIVYTDYDYGSKEELSIEKAIAKGFDGYEMSYKNDNVGEGELPAWVIALAMIVLFAILFAMSKSWFEPVLYMIAIGAAVLINSGTNIIQGEVSIMTFMICALLQMVLSMDYSIILMNRYRQELELCPEDRVQAMKNALTHSFSSIFSSGMTTVIGLLMLLFLSFKIGSDLGIALAKGVFLSMVCVCTLQPGLILLFTDLIMKTGKKELNLPMKRVSAFSYRFHKPLALLFVVLFVGTYFLQNITEITYTLSQEDKIAEQFPTENQIVVLYRNEDEAVMAEQADKLLDIDGVNSVFSYSSTLAKPFTVEEMSNLIQEMSSDAKIDSSLLRIVYYDKFAGQNYPSMTLQEFVSFIQNDIMTDPQFSSYMDPSMESTLDQYSAFLDPAALTSQKSASEIASLFGIDSSQVEQLMVYYNTKYGGSAIRMTLPAFANFIINDVASDPEYSSMIGESQMAQLQSFQALTKSQNLTQPVNYSQAASILGISESDARMLYICYCALSGQSDGDTMTATEFIRFMDEDLASDPAFSSYISEDSKEQIRQLDQIVTAASSGNSLTAGLLGQALSLNEDVINGLFSLAGDDEDSMTVDKALELIVSNSASSLGMDEESAEQLQTASRIIKASALGTTYDYNGMASLIGLDSSMVRMIYAYRHMQNMGEENLTVSVQDLVNTLSANKDVLASMAGSDQVSQIDQLQQIVNASVSGTAYTASEIAQMTGMDSDQIAMLFTLYQIKNGGNRGLTMSVQEFVNFLVNDVMNNATFSGYIDSSQAGQLRTAQSVINAVVSGQTYSPSEMYSLLGGLSDQLDQSRIELLYLYYGSKYASDSEWKMSILDLFDYISGTMLNDSRFTDLIDEDMRQEILSKKTVIEDSVSQLKGPDYSLMLISTDFPVESDETESFYRSMVSDMDSSLSGDHYYIGYTPMNYEMADNFHHEMLLLTLLTAFSIFLVVLLTFRSLVIPLILVSLVQCGVYITVVACGLLGYSIYYIALLIVQCILMGATIDYAILFTNYYRENRRSYPIKESLDRTYQGATHTIMTSGLILILVTGVVGFTPKVDPTIGQICQTISIGALSATLLILFVLPGLLITFDKIVTRNSGRLKESPAPVPEKPTDPDDTVQTYKDP